MTTRTLSVRRLAPIAVLALVAGAAAAQAAGGGGSAQPQSQPPPAAAAPAPVLASPALVRGSARRALRAMPAGVAVVPAAPTFTPAVPSAIPLTPATVPLPAALCPPRNRNAARTPPSDALKNAFAILRRERNDDHALPARALAALKARGLQPVDPQSARLLRADGAARAWVVPVPDVNVASPLFCGRTGAVP